jgi:hypothetical protein
MPALVGLYSAMDRDKDKEVAVCCCLFPFFSPKKYPEKEVFLSDPFRRLSKCFKKGFWCLFDDNP